MPFLALLGMDGLACNVSSPNPTPLNGSKNHPAFKTSPRFFSHGGLPCWLSGPTIIKGAGEGLEVPRCPLAVFKWHSITHLTCWRDSSKRKCKRLRQSKQKASNYSNPEERRKGVNNSGTVTNRNITELQVTDPLYAKTFTQLVDCNPFPAQLPTLPNKPEEVSTLSAYFRKSLNPKLFKNWNNWKDAKFFLRRGLKKNKNQEDIRRGKE